MSPQSLGRSLCRLALNARAALCLVATLGGCATPPSEPSSGQAPATAAAASTPAPSAPKTWWDSGPSFLSPRAPSGPIVESVLAGSQHPPWSIESRYSKPAVASPFGSFGQVDFSGSHLRTLAQSYGAMWAGSVLRLPGAGLESASICGPSSSSFGRGGLACFSRSSGESLDQLPIPGELSAAPLFHNGSWVLATTKGFLFRASGLSERGTPVLGGDNSAFWGARSRDRMAMLRNLYRNVSSGDQSASMAASGAELQYVQSGWSWFHWSSAPFVSPLVVQGARVLAMTANQFVYSIDFESGKIVWAQRVGATEDLQIQSRALAVTSGFVVAGTAEGQVAFLSPESGKMEFQVEIPRKPSERFTGVVAQPLVAGQRILVSNGSSSTAMINERSRKIEWQLEVGSVASPKRWGEAAFVGAVDGRILKVELASGAVVAERLLRRGEPVASIAVVLGGNHVLVAMRDGEVLVLRASDLVPVQSFASQGGIMGEWLGGDEQSGACVSTREGWIRCFALQSMG